MNDVVTGSVVQWGVASASRFSGRGTDPDHYVRFERGAFAESLCSAIPKRAWQDHGCRPGEPYGDLWADDNRILGSTWWDTLELWEDSTGLGFKLRLPDSAAGLLVRDRVRAGVIRGASPGWETEAFRRDVDAAGRPIKTVTKAHLFDVSLMIEGNAAWPGTKATIRLCQDQAFAPHRRSEPARADGGSSSVPSWVPFNYRRQCRPWVGQATAAG
jgi:HK97 family phage prohead protease